MTFLTYLSKLISYAISWSGTMAPKAVNGPFDGMTIGFSSKSLASSALSVMITSSAPLAFT